MEQAKKRGTYEQRVAQAQERQSIEAKQWRKEAIEDEAHMTQEQRLARGKSMIDALVITAPSKRN